VPHWKRDLIVLCLVQSLSMIAFSSVFPLVPYYIQELGAGSYAQAASWAAIYSTGSALAMMVSAPIWGSVADRHGRKLMLARATLSGALTMGLTSLVRSPGQLVAVRIAQGLFGGMVAASTALVAFETPEQHLGVSLGVLQALQAAARAVGPIVGGVAADTLGLRAPFAISAAALFAALLAVVALVRERAGPRSPATHGSRLSWRRGTLAGVMSRNALVVLGVMGATGVGITLLSPVLSLYIQAISPGSQNIATLAGAVSSAAALTSAPAALLMGRLGDRFGPKRVLIACGLGTALLYVPQALASSPMQLMVLRGIQGAFVGGIVPTATALLARSTHPSRLGTLFGVATSARAGGRALGPLVGAASANTWGMASVFLLTGGVYGLMVIMVAALVRGAAVPAPAATEEDARPVASPCQGSFGTLCGHDHPHNASPSGDIKARRRLEEPGVSDSCHIGSAT